MTSAVRNFSFFDSSTVWKKVTTCEMNAVKNGRLGTTTAAEGNPRRRSRYLQSLSQAHAVRQYAPRPVRGVGLLHRLTAAVPHELDPLDVRRENSKVMEEGLRGPTQDRIAIGFPLKKKTCGAERTKKSGAVLRLTVHLVRLQAGHQVPVHLNEGRPGLFVLIQDQLGGDGKRALGHLSPVLHLLLPVGQAPAPLLLLSESLLGLRAEVLVVHYPADLSAASGRAFKARLAVGIRIIALFDLENK